jgi:hypothetical protein
MRKILGMRFFAAIVLVFFVVQTRNKFKATSSVMIKDEVSVGDARALVPKTMIDIPTGVESVDWNKVYGEWFTLSQEFFSKIKHPEYYQQYVEMYQLKKKTIHRLRVRSGGSRDVQLELDQLEKSYQTKLKTMLGDHFKSFLKLQSLYEEDVKLSPLDF